MERLPAVSGLGADAVGVVLAEQQLRPGEVVALHRAGRSGVELQRSINIEIGISAALGLV